jgi:predicted CopG family antitoxin
MRINEDTYKQLVKIQQEKFPLSKVTAVARYLLETKVKDAFAELGGQDQQETKKEVASLRPIKKGKQVRI